MAINQAKLESNLKVQEKKRVYIREFKEQRGCHDCGQKFPHYVLEFDHVPERGVKSHKIDPTKYGWDKLHNEMAKCDVVCDNCHNIRTWRRYQGQPPAL